MGLNLLRMRAMKTKKLLLSKEKVRELSVEELGRVDGGTELVAAGWIRSSINSSVLSGNSWTGTYNFNYYFYP